MARVEATCTTSAADEIKFRIKSISSAKIRFFYISPDSLSITSSCSSCLMERSLLGVRDHTRRVESENPVHISAESSEISTDVNLHINTAPTIVGFLTLYILRKRFHYPLSLKRMLIKKQEAQDGPLSLT